MSSVSKPHDRVPNDIEAQSGSDDDARRADRTPFAQDPSPPHLRVHDGLAYVFGASSVQMKGVSPERTEWKQGMPYPSFGPESADYDQLLATTGPVELRKISNDLKTMVRLNTSRELFESKDWSLAGKFASSSAVMSVEAVPYVSIGRSAMFAGYTSSRVPDKPRRSVTWVGRSLVVIAALLMAVALVRWLVP